ncbi:diacylglycerol O-acyltransferase 3-like [Bidens hawaiensis]|uniref:diacylglycerol O-acyltransferase 3-like n=1 Tax=Bidens hawaiensis TaxID=980011 RepID=UPI004049D0E6
MEVAGVVFRQSAGFSSTAADVSISRQSIIKPNSIRVKERKWAGGLVVSGEYSDKGHLQYYEGIKKKEVKKKLKLLKGLSKNLNTFTEMGFCLDPDSDLDQQVKGKMISEATEVLLGQLQKLKEEKMEYKRIKKEEKDKKKASRMTTMMKSDCKDSSSSESSSSESDCDNVVNMSQLKTVRTSNTNQEPTSSSSVQIPEKAENIVITDTAIVNEVDCGKKIEVCMGGKCKKSGAAALLENFQAAVGGDAAVVGCKCMGKCREGPNLKVHTEEEAVTNSLCIGVGLEDVDTIVTNFFGGSQRSCSVMVPALT